MLSLAPVRAERCRPLSMVCGGRPRHGAPGIPDPVSMSSPRSVTARRRSIRRKNHTDPGEQSRPRRARGIPNSPRRDNAPGLPGLIRKPGVGLVRLPPQAPIGASSAVASRMCMNIRSWQRASSPAGRLPAQRRGSERQMRARPGGPPGRSICPCFLVLSTLPQAPIGPEGQAGEPQGLVILRGFGDKPMSRSRGRVAGISRRNGVAGPTCQQAPASGYMVASRQRAGIAVLARPDHSGARAKTPKLRDHPRTFPGKAIAWTPSVRCLRQTRGLWCRCPSLTVRGIPRRILRRAAGWRRLDPDAGQQSPTPEQRHERSPRRRVTGSRGPALRPRTDDGHPRELQVGTSLRHGRSLDRGGSARLRSSPPRDDRRGFGGGPGPATRPARAEACQCGATDHGQFSGAPGNSSASTSLAAARSPRSVANLAAGRRRSRTAVTPPPRRQRDAVKRTAPTGLLPKLRARGRLAASARSVASKTRQGLARGTCGAGALVRKRVARSVRRRPLLSDQDTRQSAHVRTQSLPPTHGLGQLAASHACDPCTQISRGFDRCAALSGGSIATAGQPKSLTRQSRSQKRSRSKEPEDSCRRRPECANPWRARPEASRSHRAPFGR